MFSEKVLRKRSTNDAHPCSLPGYVLDRLKHWISYFLLLESIRSERRTLSKLTKDELLDIGVQRTEADRESQKSYWNVPDNRQ